ncbi:peptide chain release factor 2 [Candidatus Fermentibacteria bacterium]|nr:peptide chain release factor 2 [Candidatus Fermentibacteria bacterium]
MGLQELQERVAEAGRRLAELKSAFDYDELRKKERSLSAEMANPDFWDDHSQAIRVVSRLKRIQLWTKPLEEQREGLEDLRTALELLSEESDEELMEDSSSELAKIEKQLDSLEFRQMLSGENDSEDAILQIRSGAGGIDSQDWAEMLLRMYTYWAEKQGFELEVMTHQEGDEAGIREAAVSVKGPYAYGYLRAESGIHRLVRKSPFDQNHRRHTSFASVFALPDLDDSIEVEIKSDDLRVDTFRASGAGGQHVNKTSSAVRITHEPTGIVVSCQNQRSQHRNREVAMRILRARLYELEQRKREDEKAKLEEDKKDVSWGNQIRSYVLHPYRMVKDHRTNLETSDVDAVLSGDLQEFIEAYLREGSS